MKEVKDRNKMNKSKISIVLFILILFLGFYFRFYGINWDQGQHLHPDERFLTMVTGAIQWPKSLHEYLDTTNSPLNPHNKGFGFFVYGTFPIFFTKWFIDTFAKEDYNSITLIGRQLSAMVDLGTVVLVFLIGKQILKSTNSQINKFSNKNLPKLLDYLKLDNWIIGLFAAFIYAAMVLPIQLSHFYAVDTYLTFFITLSFYILIKLINSKFIGNWKLEIGNYAIPLGIAFGLALASKISAVLFLPIIGLGFLYLIIRDKKITLLHCYIVTLFIISTYLTFRLTQPYLFVNSNIFNFALNPKVLDNWKVLKSFDGPNTGFPPALQWIPTKPYIYPITNLIIWGVGPVIGSISILAFIYQSYLCTKFFLKKKLKSFTDNNQIIISLTLVWIILLFGYQAGQFAKALRYLYPMLPFVAMISGVFIYEVNKLFNRRHKFFGVGLICIIGLIMIVWTRSFVFIYSRLQSRVSTSMWIYKNIPLGSTIANEHWDDPQPLYNTGGNPGDYKGMELTMYYPDSDANKWQQMADKLEKTDYIAITSNRLWRSLSAIPWKYPQTARYYQALFDGSLGFKQLIAFSSHPCLLPKNKIDQTPSEITNIHPPLISLITTNYCYFALNDDGAEESFTVYDHPKVIIFKKTPNFSTAKLFNIINATNDD